MKSYSIFIALLILLSPVVYGKNFKLIGDAVAQASEATEQQVAELYVATFNRAPDKPGLDFWVNDSGFTIEQIAQSFFDQTETQALYPPGTTETAFVTSVYDNLFNRAPDSAGLAYWVDALGSGAVTRPVMIEAVKNGALGTDAEIVANKTEAGLYYASLGLEGGGFSLAAVTGDVATVTLIKGQIDNHKKGISEGNLLHGTSYKGDLYKIYRIASDEQYKDILDNPSQWIDTIIVEKNGIETLLNYHEAKALLGTIPNLRWPTSILAGEYWDQSWGVWRPDCLGAASLACGQATWGFDPTERKNVYKDLVTQIITGYPNPADRKISRVTDEISGATALVDDMPQKYYTIMESFGNLNNNIKDTLGITNNLLTMFNDGAQLTDDFKALASSQQAVFTNAMTALNGAMVAGQVAISFQKKLAIHEYIVNYTNSLIIIEELKNAHSYIVSNVNPNIDPAFLEALNEIENEIVESSNSMATDYLSPLLAAVTDENFENVLKLGMEISGVKDFVAKHYIKRLGTTFSSSSKKLITEGVGSYLDIGTSLLFLAIDAEKAWENIFLSAHIQHMLALYWNENNRAFTPIEYDNEQNGYFVYNENLISQREIVVSLCEASSILYYDMIVNLVDPQWGSVMIDIAGSALSGMTTGTALTPLPYFGSAVMVGQALGKSASCADSILGDNDKSCEDASTEVREIREDLSVYYNAMKTWTDLITQRLIDDDMTDTDGDEDGDEDGGDSSNSITNSLGMTFARIEPGTFAMGSHRGVQHQVTLTQAYYMQTTEVTRSQWEAVMGNDPSQYLCGSSECPVDSVPWDDIQTFIDRLNAMGEGEHSLPTEAQWEYAARAGSTTDFPYGNLDNRYSNYKLDTMGWYLGNSSTGSHPVKQKEPNAWGLYDMHGNLVEWCKDWYGIYPLGPVTNPEGPLSGSYKVLRGGSIWSDAEGCTSAARSYRSPDTTQLLTNGFRLVRVIDTQNQPLSTTYYYDNDGDGYGDPNNSIESNFQPSGYVTDYTDCYDFDDSIFPGAPEIRNDGIDQDCNGSDLSPLITYYRDFDGDGYGDPNFSTESDLQPSGYITNNSDCNDTDANINPEENEVCSDNIDNNCNNSVDEGCSVSNAVNVTGIWEYNAYYENCSQDAIGQFFIQNGSFQYNGQDWHNNCSVTNGYSESGSLNYSTPETKTGFESAIQQVYDLYYGPQSFEVTIINFTSNYISIQFHDNRDGSNEYMALAR